MRVLVTGSRTWDQPEVIVKALWEAWVVRDDSFVIVHGDCKKGADKMADDAARRYGWDTDPHPADWEKHGKAAGFRRNNEMVRLGADVCLAFIKDSSRGASQCAMAAEWAGIPVRRYEC